MNDCNNPTQPPLQCTRTKKEQLDGLIHLHAQHNSMVDFSFMSDLSSCNEITLTRLNALFERIADRNSMAIRADKLFRIISKTDRSKTSIERYRIILNIASAADCGNGKIQGCNGVLRVISRGPFLSMFKHESKAFVNSLENSARVLKMNRKKRKRKNSSCNSSADMSCCGSCNSVIRQPPSSQHSSSSKEKEDVASTKRTVVTAPAALSSDADKPKSLKRKKSDNVGMIILTDRDCCDEMSAVSVSPVNVTEEKKVHSQAETQAMRDVKQGSSLQDVPVNAPSSSRKIIVAKVKMTPRTKSKRKKKESARKSSRKEKSATSKSSRDHKSYVHRQNNEKQSGGHHRHDSSTESISNIREVMQANTTPLSNKRQKTRHYTPRTPFESAWLKNGTVQSQNQQPMNDPSPYAPHPLIYPMQHGHAHGMTWKQMENVYSSANAGYNQTEKESDHCSDDDSNLCFIFGGLVSFIKQLMRPQKKNIIQSDPRRGYVPHCFTAPVNEPNYSHIAGMNNQEFNTQYQLKPNNDFLMYNQHRFNCNGYRSVGYGVAGYDPNMIYHENLLNQNSKIIPANHFTAPSLHSAEESKVNPAYNNKKVKSDYNDNHNLPDKLGVYDYEPRIKLPEPGSYKQKDSKSPRNRTTPFDESRSDASDRYQEESKERDSNSLGYNSVHHNSHSSTYDEQSISSKTEFTRESESKHEQTKIQKTVRTKSKDKRKAKVVAKVCAAPQLKGRSRSLSDARFRQVNSLATSSLTRTSSFGSSVSSICGSSEAEKILNCGEMRYYHYR